MTQLPHGWVKFAPASYWRAPTGPSTGRSRLRLSLAAIAVTSFVAFWLGDDIVDPLLLAYAAVFTVSLLPTVIEAIRNPTPEFNFDTNEVRVARRAYSMTQITQASFLELPAHKRTDWFLQFGGVSKPQLFVVVSSHKRAMIDANERELVAEVLRRSSVTIPTPAPDPYDPTGKFAWMDHPNSLTKVEAIEYVLHTPESGGPVRTPSPAKSIWINDND